MHYLYAPRGHVAQIEEVVAEQALTDVKVTPPFLGKAVIWCGSNESRALLVAVLEQREAA